MQLNGKAELLFFCTRNSGPITELPSVFAVRGFCYDDRIFMLFSYYCHCAFIIQTPAKSFQQQSQQSLIKQEHLAASDLQVILDVQNSTEAAFMKRFTITLNLGEFFSPSLVALVSPFWFFSQFYNFQLNKATSRGWDLPVALARCFLMFSADVLWAFFLPELLVAHAAACSVPQQLQVMCHHRVAVLISPPWLYSWHVLIATGILYPRTRSDLAMQLVDPHGCFGA